MRPVHLLASLLALLAITCGAHARGPDSYERWYVVELMGSKSGYAHTAQRQDARPHGAAHERLRAPLS